MADIDAVSKRFLGLDIGDAYTKLSFSAYDDTGKPVEPVLIAFDKRVLLHSAMLYENGWGNIKKLEDIARGLAALPVPAVKLHINSDFESEPAHASQALNALVAHVFSVYDNQFFHSRINKDDFSLAIGMLANCKSAHRQNLLESVKSTGITVETYDDAVAAVTYLLFKEKLPFRAGAHSWLVVDAGSQDLRLVLVRKPANRQELQAELIASFPWGGMQIDEILYHNFFQTSYRANLENFDEAQKPFILLLLRILKERLSQQINQGNSRASLSFNLPGIEDPIELTREKFESRDVCNEVIEEFKKLLESAPFNSQQDVQNVDRIVLVGGNANWYFVRQSIKEKWGPSQVYIPSEPEQVVAKGLPLLMMGYRPAETVEPKTQPRPKSPLPPSSPPLPPKAPSTPSIGFEEKIASYHKQARSLILKCIIVGAIFAFIVAPVPCAAWPILTIVEAYMLIKIVQTYGYRLEPDLIGGIVVLLLGVSFILSLVIGEVVSTLLLYVGAFIVKPVVAGAVIWGLGEAALKVLDQQKRKR